MKNNIIITIIVIVILIASGAYYLISNKKDTNNPNPSGTINGNEIAISNFAFSQATLNIKAGEKVTWTNQDSSPHTIISDSGNEISSTSLSKGNSYEHAFSTAGIYNYHCGIHPNMKAKIIVE